MSSERIGSVEQEHYAQHGYVIVPGLFDEKSLTTWRGRLEAIVNGRIPPADHMLVMKDIMVAKGAVQTANPAEAIAKVQDFEADPVLYGYARDPRLLDCVAGLIGEDLLSIHTMLINKPPNVDGRHPLHQDIIYFPFRPAERIVGTWTALEPVHKENGCLVAIPGSHHGEIMAHEHPDWDYVNLGYVGVSGIGADDRRVHFELQPGDTILFHPHLIHGSGRNRSEGFRRAISAHFASAHCEMTPQLASFLPSRYYTPVRGERPSWME
ncbi:MAG: phytanoyl-CoA dioxygenase family protein [Deltaproteobacteria bacterium]|nr:phytanoyl-CoA dioxygenase family protein [Deltaproteobacteria bacterium]MBW2696705.1 phytanoyl-CoA dioxygenase family protein [Deltaproteobacteria bacterium]